MEEARRAADDRLDAAERDAAARLHEAEAFYENQRAKAAKASADFETTLARRRQAAEQEFNEQMDESRGRLADLEAQISQARADAEVERSEAARETQRLLSDAHEQAEALVAEAKATAARIRADSDRELAAASQRRDAINAQLANVRQMLSALTGVVPAVALEDVELDEPVAEDDALVEDAEDAEDRGGSCSRRSRRRLPPAEGYYFSRIRVIGPSLTDSTRMSAPNTPRSTCAPSRSSSAHTASYAGSLISPGCRRLPGGSPALARVAVQRELADHEHRSADVGGGLLVAQEPEVPDLPRRPRDLVRAVLVGDTQIDQEAGTGDLAHDLAVDLDPSLEHPLDHRSHAAHPLRSLPGGSASVELATVAHGRSLGDRPTRALVPQSAAPHLMTACAHA